MVTRKQKEIEELLRREISSIILRDLEDPRIGFVTVTRVHVGGDYRTAKVYLMIRGDEQEKETTLDVLTNARGRIQGLVANRIEMRNTPVLTFMLDEEMLEALRVDRLIDEVMKEQDEPAD
ncbi:MAG: 30S ribosome-binding factor RbfA [Planctomycetota bacterium]